MVSPSFTVNAITEEPPNYASRSADEYENVDTPDQAISTPNTATKAAINTTDAASANATTTTTGVASQGNEYTNTFLKPVRELDHSLVYCSAYQTRDSVIRNLNSDDDETCPVYQNGGANMAATGGSVERGSSQAGKNERGAKCGDGKRR